MSTIKNGQISLYCNFNETIKGPGTSSQSPALSQKHVRNVIRYTSIWRNFILIVLTLIKKLTDINQCLTDQANQCLTDA